jgi:hypothetical protein
VPDRAQVSDSWALIFVNSRLISLERGGSGTKEQLSRRELSAGTFVEIDSASTIDYHPASLRDLGETNMEMDKWSFGLTMMIIGMGGTFLTLWILSLVIDVLKKVFPLAEKSSADKKS